MQWCLAGGFTFPWASPLQLPSTACGGPGIPCLLAIYHRNTSVVQKAKDLEARTYVLIMNGHNENSAGIVLCYNSDWCWMVLCLLLQLSHLYYVALYKVSVLVCGLYQATLQLSHAVGCYEDLNTTFGDKDTVPNHGHDFWTDSRVFSGDWTNWGLHWASQALLWG